MHYDFTSSKWLRVVVTCRKNLSSLFNIVSTEYSLRLLWIYTIYTCIKIIFNNFLIQCKELTEIIKEFYFFMFFLSLVYYCKNQIIHGANEFLQANKLRECLEPRLLSVQLKLTAYLIKMHAALNLASRTMWHGNSYFKEPEW